MHSFHLFIELFVWLIFIEYILNLLVKSDFRLAMEFLKFGPKLINLLFRKDGFFSIELLELHHVILTLPNHICINWRLGDNL